MSKKFFCPNCGSAIAPEDKFCLNCGHKLIEDSTPSPKAQPTPAQSGPYAPTQSAPYPYAPIQPAPYPYGHPAPQFIGPGNYVQIKANYGDRCLALFVDSFIYTLCPILWLFRDIIPEHGQSIGKSMMKIRVVDYDSGDPITFEQSCLRNICLGFLFGIDLIVPLCNDEGRRVGDYLAGTIVIEDR